MKIQFQAPGITIFESALFRTTSCVLELDNKVLLVDPNWLPYEIDFIRNFVDQTYPNHNRFLYFTHADFDHIIGYKAFPEAVTIGDFRMANHSNKKNYLKQILDFDNEFYIKRNYPIEFPDIQIQIDKNEFVSHDFDTGIMFFLTPGHVDNGSAAIFPSQKLCIAGDYLSNIEIPWVEYGFKSYLHTLELFQRYLTKYNIEMLVTGHGDIAIGKTEIHRRLDEDVEYVRSFLDGNVATEAALEKLILSKGNDVQNRNIHHKNISFFQQGRKD